MNTTSWQALARERELAQAKAQRHEAELRLSVLAAQVEPHFLFNTLAGVRSAIATDPARASEMIDRLVDYLRAAIPRLRSDGRVQATLGAQLDIVRAYLGLMAARMPRLQWSVDAAPALLAAHCPPLMLISLAENAVKHGVERKIGAARIDVRADRDEQGRLRVTVLDDGAGFSRQQQRHRHRPGQHPRTAGIAVPRPGRTAAQGAARRRRGGQHRGAFRDRRQRLRIPPMPTALIADDEDLPRAELRRMLAAAWPDLQVLAECEHGEAALEALAEHQPDIAFLDIRMPGASGLDVARAASGRCHVVFTTAYDSHAIEAFEAGAVDYLLKPVCTGRPPGRSCAVAPWWLPGSCSPPGERCAGAQRGRPIKMFAGRCFSRAGGPAGARAQAAQGDRRSAPTSSGRCTAA